MFNSSVLTLLGVLFMNRCRRYKEANFNIRDFITVITQGVEFLHVRIPLKG